MDSKEGEWEEAGEGLDKEENLTCSPRQGTTSGLGHAFEQF